MRILYASKGYHPLIGGVETVVRQLAEGVAAVGEAEVLVCHHEAFARASPITPARNNTASAPR